MWLKVIMLQKVHGSLHLEGKVYEFPTDEIRIDLVRVLRLVLCIRLPD
jgi:hypothetical protein